jgi:ubiquitin carboxyl-terminal hydrolase 47
VHSDEDEVLDTDVMCILKNWEMYLQVLDLKDEHDVAAKYSGCNTAIFTRRWYPSTLTLGKFVDLPLSNLDRIELSRMLTTLSGLPAERIEIAKGPGTFPCDGSLLAIQDDISWVPLLSDDGSPTFKYPCSIQSDGDVVYWRDKDEPPKKLTEQERRDILRRENSDSGNSTSVTNTYTSSRKERPLRIFLDSPSTSVKQNQEPELD